MAARQYGASFHPACTRMYALNHSALGGREGEGRGVEQWGGVQLAGKVVEVGAGANLWDG